MRLNWKGDCKIVGFGPTYCVVRATPRWVRV